MLLFSHQVLSDSLHVTPRTVAHQAPLFMGFPGKNPGVGCHFLLQGIFLPRDQTGISYTADRFLTAETTGKPPKKYYRSHIFLANHNFSRELVCIC